MKKYLAEMIGTMVLVLIGCGSAVIAGGQIGFLGISFAFGFSVLAMAYGIGSISGCHINPAVTVGALVAGRISAKDAGMYVVFQIIGAIIGAGVLYYIASGLQGYNINTNGLGQNGFGEFSPMKYSMAAGFVAEVVLTFIFLIVILGATSSKAPAGFAGIPIGISLVIIHLVGIPITGTSVNPARSIGPALFVGGAAISQLWVFIVAPLIGAVIAGLVWKYVLEEKA
ncbi:MAG: aquaporin Z [Ignavibacteria bacterium]